MLTEQQLTKLEELIKNPRYKNNQNQCAVVSISASMLQALIDTARELAALKFGTDQGKNTP